MLKNACVRIRYLSKLFSEGTTQKFLLPGCPLPIVGSVKSGHCASIRCISTTGYLQKSKKNRSKTEIESDSDDEEENIEFQDEYNSKVIKTKVPSLRTDAIVKSAFGVSRNKVEEIFYNSRIRVNGEKLPKKSIQINEGDEVDVIQHFSPNNTSHLIVNRVTLLSATAHKDGYQVHLRRYKNLLVENYSGNNAHRATSIIDQDTLA